ncbi:MAG: DUF4352 domain-containing protein [Candidatus Eremiobacterota bacterium]
MRWRMLLLGVLTSLCLHAAAGAQADMALYANGIRVSTPVLVRDGVAYAPAQALATALGLTVSWDPGLNVVSVNGQPVDGKPFNQDGKVFVPIDGLARAAGGSVEWDGANRRIMIATKGGAPTASASPVPAQPTYTPAPDNPYANPAPAQTASRPQQTVSDPNWVQPGAVPAIANNLPASMRMPIMDLTIPTTTGLPTAPVTEMASRNTDRPGISMAQNPARTGDVFVPRGSQNSIFAVTVTNVQTVGTLKDYYQPRNGYKYVIVYLSQQNISNEVQIYTGKFTLRDQGGNAFAGLDNLSNFWLVVLRPQGVNFGYIVYELPAQSQPAELVLTTVNQPPLGISLR